MKALTGEIPAVNRLKQILCPADCSARAKGRDPKPTLRATKRWPDYLRVGPIYSSACAARWMRRVVHLGERLEIEVGVDLRARDRGVPSISCTGAQVARRLQHVRGERVPQHMRMDVPRDATPLDAHVASRRSIDPRRAYAVRRRRRRAHACLRGRDRLPLCEPHARSPPRAARADRHDPLLRALAPDTRTSPPCEVDAIDVELARARIGASPDEYASSNKRAVAHRQRIVAVDGDKADRFVGVSADGRRSRRFRRLESRRQGSSRACGRAPSGSEERPPAPRASAARLRPDRPPPCSVRENARDLRRA